MSKVVSHPVPSAQSVAHRAAQAVFQRRAIGAMGVWLVRLLSLALMLIGLSKAVGWEKGSNWWWGWIVGASAGALVLGVVDALRARLSDAQGAGVLDDRLGLKGLLRSSIELDIDWEIKEQTPGFVALALAQAQSAAGQVEVQRAMDPIDTKYWKQAGTLIVLAVVAGIWLPMRVGSASAPVRVVPEQAIAQIDSIQDSIVDEIEVEESPAVQEAIAELESLKEELAQGVDDPEQANARAAARLEELAEALDEQAQQDQAKANELADRIAQAQNQEEQFGDDLFNDFAQAIKEQEYADAQKELEALREQLDQMSDAQREALADRLEQLADAVEPDPLEVDPMPEQSTIPEPAQDLADSLREEAKQIREPESKSQPESDQQPEDQSGQQSDSQSNPQSTKSAQDQQEKKGQQEQQGQSSESGKKQSGQKQSSEHQPSDQPGEQPAEYREPTEEQGKQKDQSTQTQKQGEQQGRQEQQGQTQEGQRPEQDEQGKQEDQPRQDQASESNGEEQQEQQEAQDQSGQQQERRSLDETLQKMERRKERIQRNQEQADDIRQQARELIEPNRSQELPQPQEQGEDGQGRRALSEENQPEQRRSPGDGPRTGEDEPVMNDPNAVSDFVPLDASGPDRAQNTNPVGKWYAPDGETPEPGSARQAAQRFKEASKQAQRAIEQYQVPRKYRRIVREAFKRIEERADAIESGGKIAPQGKDATPKSSSSSKAGADE